MPEDRSYRALLRVPELGRVLVAMQLARIASSMVSVAIVLFTLQQYHSPQLAGLVTFAAIFPGLLASPVAGALLDRHGRVRLIGLDFAVAMVAMLLIGGLSIADSLPAPLLVLIAGVSSITSILSHTGLRSLFPLMVPPELWERVNAVDSNGYVVATIVGPPLAAALVAVLGGAQALLLISVLYAFALVALIGVPDPPAETSGGQGLLRDSWDGLRYVASNPTLRALGASLSVANLGFGMITILIPLIVLDQLGGGEVAVGVAFAVSGIFGMISATSFGRLDSRGLEWRMIVLPSIALVPAMLLLLPGTGALGLVAPLLAYAFVLLSMALQGLTQGPMDIGIFTVRQRRTDPAWFGRAFAVSMALNFLGFPIGAAIAGSLAPVSLPATVVLAAACVALSTVLAAVLLPRREPARSIAEPEPPAEPEASNDGVVQGAIGR
jgi:MFS family permease